MTVQTKGFTLVELVVAIALFAFVAVGAISAMIAVVDGNKKARALVGATDALGFALESMTRELRVGSNYSCDGGGDCPPGGGGPGSEIAFTTSEGSVMVYRLNTGRLERCGSTGIDCPDPTNAANYVAMTGSNITITDFDVYVQGSAPSPADSEQPRATLVISGTAGNNPGIDSSFTIQTTVTQRFPDL